MTTVLVLEGPNLNLVGTREPEIYGNETLEQIHDGIRAHANELGLTVDFFQSNHEGALIDRLHRRDFDVAIVNAGGLTHTSVALLNERASAARDAGRAKAAAGRRAIRDAEREREILLRVSMANEGPLPQAQLLAFYRRLFVATRALEARDREQGRRDRDG